MAKKKTAWKSERPNVKSSIREIKAYQPKNWADAVSWNAKVKGDLLRKKRKS